MTSLPLTDAPRLADAARRTAVVQTVLAVVAVAATLGAVLVGRDTGTRELVPLARDGDTIVVVDLSASISTDTYSQIGATLSSLAQTDGRLGLILFSDQAYVALPQGTPAADLAPVARLFTVPKTTQAGFTPTLPPNPWTAAFSGGTKISAGLTLAHTIAVSTRRRPTVVLVSDLSDDPRDLPRLGSILLAYRRDGVPVRIVGLDPAPADLALFRRALGGAAAGPAPEVVRAPAPGVVPVARTPFPWQLALCALLACGSLAVLLAWAPPLDWRTA